MGLYFGLKALLWFSGLGIWPRRSWHTMSERVELLLHSHSLFHLFYCSWPFFSFILLHILNYLYTGVAKPMPSVLLAARSKY